MGTASLDIVRGQFRVQIIAEKFAGFAGFSRIVMLADPIFERQQARS